MSWAAELNNVYEKNFEVAQVEAIPLLPEAHSTVKAQIEVTIDEAGNFVFAQRVDEEDSKTVIPVTEDSGGRTSGIAPHPLADTLPYLAKDYRQFTSGQEQDDTKYQLYIKQLEGWKTFKAAHPAVTAIYCYLTKGTLMHDLIESRVLIVDATTGILLENEKINGIAQDKAFVRFKVNYQDLCRENKTWKDRSLQGSFISYNHTLLGKPDLCYATGQVLPVTYKHPLKILGSAQKAKLISSNDESGFSYRGRFSSKEEAFSVSYSFSQQAHNALKWLVERQGLRIGSLTLVVWESNSQELPNIINNPATDYYDEDFSDDKGEDSAEDNETYGNAIHDTLPVYRERLKKVIWGNKEEFKIKSKAMLMGLTAATPGRLSITVYLEMLTSDFLYNIEQWHASIAWHKFIPKLKKNQISSFSLYEILNYAFGTEQSEVIKCKDEILTDNACRLIPCITEGKRIPEDIMRNLFIRATKPTAYKKRHNWRKVLECACGIIKKFMLERNYNGGLKEENIMDDAWKSSKRDCLYGRLLAIADAAERSTYEKGSERATNAQRYFEAFSDRPYQTWDILYKRLKPYLDRMPEKTRRYYSNLLMEIHAAFVDMESFKDNSKLKPEFLLAYYCQLKAIYTPTNNNDNNKKEEE